MLSKRWYDDYRRKGVVIAYDEKTGLGVIGTFSKKNKLLSYLKLNTSLDDQVYRTTGLIGPSRHFTESPIYFFRDTRLGGVVFSERTISVGQIVSFTAYGNQVAADLFLCHGVSRSNPLLNLSNVLIGGVLLAPTAIATFLCLATDQYSNFQVFWWQILLTFAASFIALVPLAMVLESKVVPFLSEFEETDFSFVDSRNNSANQKEICELANQILSRHTSFVPEELNPEAM